MFCPIQVFHVWADQYVHRQPILYNGLFSLDTNFPKWWTLGFSRNFPSLEIHEPKYRKFHVINISNKFYMGKAIICCAHVMSTVII